MYTATGQNTDAHSVILHSILKSIAVQSTTQMFLRSNGILTVDSALVVTDGTIDVGAHSLSM